MVAARKPSLAFVTKTALVTLVSPKKNKKKDR